MIDLVHEFTFTATLAAPVSVGLGPFGDRTIFEVTGGDVTGERLSGTMGTGAYNLGERFARKISNTATITQSIVSLWKTNDWSDSLHNFTVGVAASVTAHTELKFEFLDSFKNRPLPGLKKNDTSLITAFVWKL